APEFPAHAARHPRSRAPPGAYAGPPRALDVRHRRGPRAAAADRPLLSPPRPRRGVGHPLPAPQPAPARGRRSRPGGGLAARPPGLGGRPDLRPPAPAVPRRPGALPAHGPALAGGGGAAAGPARAA